MSQKNKIIGALWFFQIANYLDRTSISFAGPAMMKSLGLEPREFGIVLSSFALGYGISQIPGGMIADRWSPRFLLALSPMFWAFFTGMTAIASGVGMLIVFRIGLGLAEGFCNSASIKVIGDAFPPRERSLASGIISTSIAIAPAMAGPTAGYLLGVHGWRFVFLVMTAPAAASALINFLAIPNSRQDIPERRLEDASKPSIRSLLGLRSLWLTSSTWFFFYVAFSGYLGWMPSYLALERHLDVKHSGVLSGLPFAAGVVGLIAIGWLGSNGLQRHLPQLLAISYVGAATSLGIAYIAPTLLVCMIGLSGGGFFILGVIGSFAALGLNLAPSESRATYWSFVSTVGQVAAVVAPSAIGFIVSATGGFGGGFVLMIGALIGASLCALGLLPDWRRSPHHAA